MREQIRYEVSILIGPCSLLEAEAAMESAHAAADAIVSGAGTGLNYWDEEQEAPGMPVEFVEVLG